MERGRKRALVTGACGFTGGHMMELLIKEGWEVVATDLKREEHKQYYCEEGTLHPAYYEDIIEKLKVEFIPADLTKKETLVPLFEGKPPYDAIFHIASLYDYFAQWDVLYKVNVIGTKNLAELAIEYKARRFIHWSTEGVYGEAKDGPIDEDHPFNPPNNYSKSKAEQEKVLWTLHREKGLPLTVLRPAPIYGPRHRYGVYHILYGIRRIGTGVVISWYPKKKTLMFPSVHVTDLVRAALFCAEHDETIGKAYNVLSECITQTEMLEFLYDALGIKKVVRIPVYWPVYKFFSKIAMKIITALDRRARKKGVRPKVDVPMAGYLTHQYWFSNKRLKDLGFKYIYEDPRKGLWDYITWCKERGWL
jgi:dihydroflavonol-4-reductase